MNIILLLSNFNFLSEKDVFFKTNFLEDWMMSLSSEDLKVINDYRIQLKYLKENFINELNITSIQQKTNFIKQKTKVLKINDFFENTFVEEHDEFKITELFFKVGDHVRKSQTIFTIETDKVSADVCSDIDFTIFDINFNLNTYYNNKHDLFTIALT